MSGVPSLVKCYMQGCNSEGTVAAYATANPANSVPFCKFHARSVGEWYRSQRDPDAVGFREPTGDDRVVWSFSEVMDQ